MFGFLPKSVGVSRELMVATLVIVGPPSLECQLPARMFEFPCTISFQRCFLVTVFCLMDSRLHALNAQRAALNGAIKTTRKDLAKVAKRKPEDGHVGRVVSLSIRLAHVIWIMYSLSADPSLAVLNVLRGAGRRRRWSDSTDAELLAMAETSFLDADVAQVSALIDEENPADPRAMLIARRRLAEEKCYLWARSLNLEKGAAPSTVALLRRAKQEQDMLPAAIFAVTSKGRPSLKARRWAQKWRARWHARLGTLRVRETLPVSERRDKVRHFFANAYVSPYICW